MMRRRMPSHQDMDEMFVQPAPVKTGRSWKFYLIIAIIVLVLAGLGFWWWKRRGSSSSSIEESCSVDSIDLKSLDGL
jgi:LPXTG-motif cell wall-anchored protein